MSAVIFKVFRYGLMMAGSLLAAQNLEAGSIYSPPYTFTTLAGCPPGSADGAGANARFSNPTSLAVDSAGNVYVADSKNSTIRKITPGGVVSTLAGLAGSPGSADGAGANARFNYPNGVAVDSAGNVYVADSGNDTIREITPGGVVSTLAGQAGSPGSADGTGTNAQFFFPSAVAVDGAGNVYVADSDNDTIREITPGGVVSTLVGQAGSVGSADGTGTNAQFNWPSGVAVDSAGNVYVADSGNYRIREITPGGVVSTLAGLTWGTNDGTGTNAQFDLPSGVAVDGAGNVYVADSDNDTIRKITSGGVVSTLAGLGGASGSADGTGASARFNTPGGVSVDSAGNVYVADSANSTIRKVTPEGAVSTLAGSVAAPGAVDGPGANARFYYPQGVAVDSLGNAYVADSVNQTIRKITPGGEVSTLAGLAGSWGSADGTGTNALFSFPEGVAVDGAGNVYVADTANYTIRKITPVGEVSTLAGLAGSWGSADGTGADARFARDVSALAVDSAGNVYVADTGNSTVRKITPAGSVSTLAGLAGFRGNADGTGTNALFAAPWGVAVDGDGNVYVADYGSYTIRKITPGGVVSTLAGRAWSWGIADGMGTNAQFEGPTGLAVDGAGNVYVADYGAIRKVTPAGEVSTLAGVVLSPGSADGTGADARFQLPRGAAVDSAGTLYVADTDNNTIRLGWAAPAPPGLKIRPVGSQLVLSWPLAASNFLVEASSTLLPAPVWVPLTNLVDTSGTRCALTTSLAPNAQYFRLRLP